jgi:CheY-like chemotaxis protein
MESIIREAQRGSELATHLSDLSRSSAGDVKVAFHPEEHVAKAAELLQLGLSPAWQVQAEIRSPLSPVPMSGLQLEQAVLNLGLLAADARSEPGVVRIIAGRPLPDSALDAGQRRAIVVLISAGDTRARSPLSYPLSELTVQRASEDGGVIQSVVRAMVEGSEGDLTLLRASDGTTIYRIGLPSAASTNPEDADQNIPPELRAYVAHWRVLAAVPKLEAADLDLQLRKAGLTVEKVETTPSALSRLDEAEKPDVVIWDRRLLRAEAPSLLRIAAKLCPGVGIVVLEEGSEVEGKEAEIPDVVLLPRRSHTVRLLRALIEAKGLAIRRQNR